MAVVGAVEVLVSADSARIASDMGKVRSVVAAGFGAMQRGAEAAMGSLTSEMGKIGPAVRGFGPAVGAATKGMELLGAKGSEAAKALGSSLAALVAGGFTPLGIAAAAATAAVSLLAAEAPKVESAFAGTEERMKSAAGALEKMRVEMDLVARGAASTSLDVEIAGAKGELHRRRMALDSAGSGGRARNVLSLGLADTDRQRAAAALQEQESYVFALEEQKRISGEIAEQRKREAAAAAADAKRRADEAAARAAADRAELARMREAAQAARSADEARRLGRAGLSAFERGDDENLARLRERVSIETERVERAAAAKDADGMTRASIAFETAREELRVAERRLEIEAERQEAARASAESDRAAAEAAETARKAQAAADAEAARAAREREDASRKAADAAARIADAERGLAFDLAQLDRTETERRVAEISERYRELLALGEAHGVDTVALEKRIAEMQARVRAEAGRAAAGGSPSEGAAPSKPGFGDDLRAFASDEIASGVSRALEDIARNGERAGQAMRAFAADFFWSVSKMAAQKATLELVTQAFSAIGWGSGGATDGSTAASGGGNIPSARALAVPRAAEFRAAASAGGASAGDMPVNVSVAIQPPAVVADEVAAKMTPRAKSAVVAQATRRPGRRAWRAGE